MTVAPLCLHCKLGIHDRALNGTWTHWEQPHNRVPCTTPEPTPLTGPQQRGYDILRNNPHIHPREFARRMWPDSPAWTRRTRGRDNHPGAIGGTMPMKGAVMLWKLMDLRLATRLDNGSWLAR